MGLRDVVTQTPGGRPGESKKKEKDRVPDEIYGPDGEPFMEEEEESSFAPEPSTVRKPRADSTLLDERGKAQLKGLVDDSREAIRKAKSNPVVSKVLGYTILFLGLYISYSIVSARLAQKTPTDAAVISAVLRSQNLNISYGVNTWSGVARGVAPDLSTKQLDVADLRVGTCRHLSNEEDHGFLDASWNCSIAYTFADKDGLRQSDSESVVIVYVTNELTGADDAYCKKCGRAWELIDHPAPNKMEGDQYVSVPFAPQATKQGGAL